MYKTLAICLCLSVLIAPRTPAAQDDPGTLALKKENELLRKENELLRKEIELLQKEIALLKGQGGPEPKGAGVTRDGVRYEFVSITMDGNVGYMKLAVTANAAGKVLDTQGIRLFTADGTEHRAPLVGVLRSNGLQTGRLTEGVRTVLEFNIGRVPAEIQAFNTIQLPGVYGPRTKARLDNPVVLRGVFNVDR